MGCVIGLLRLVGGAYELVIGGKGVSEE